MAQPVAPSSLTLVQLFNFKLVHITTKKLQGPDILSWCEPIPGEDDPEDALEEWVNGSLVLGLLLDMWDKQHAHFSRILKRAIIDASSIISRTLALDIQSSAYACRVRPSQCLLDGLQPRRTGAPSTL
jgi:hypothetical protein